MQFGLRRATLSLTSPFGFEPGIPQVSLGLPSRLISTSTRVRLGDIL